MAARVNQEDERRLNGYVRAGETHNGIAWSKLDYEDAGCWSGEDILGEYVAPRIVSSPTTKIVASGANGRSYGKIVARNLSTGIDTIFESAEKVRQVYNVSPNALRESYIDKPRQIFGNHFRSFSSSRVWCPPPSLKYNKNEWDRSKQGYIVSVRPDGVVESMYESLTAAGTLSRESQEISRNVAQNISYRLGKNQL
jgi:hypothetical protein